MDHQIIPFTPDAGLKKNQIGLDLGSSPLTGMPVPEMLLTEIIGEGEQKGELVHCDCLSLCGWLKSQGRQVDLVYIDPPFGSGAAYKSKVFLRGYSKTEEAIVLKRYDDKLTNGEYLQWLGDQLRAIRSVMSEQGAIYIHLDWHICHYVKVMMDEIFGAKNFINEIVWAYKSGGASKGSFAKKHDILYYYAKNKGKHVFHPLKEKSYNRGLKPYRFKGVNEYEDDHGWYTLVNMKDVWEIDMVGRTSKERVDYATQKPMTLLERIILTSSDPGMVVADFFGGSGVTAYTAVKNDRCFIHGDMNENSIYTAGDRLRACNGQIKVWDHIRADQKTPDECHLTVRLEEKDLHWCVIVESYRNLQIMKAVEEKNKKQDLSIEVSTSGLEMIEYISIDSVANEGPWHSSEALWINKEGNMIQNGIELKMPWDGTVKSVEKPLRVKVRDIFGIEKKLNLI